MRKICLLSIVTAEWIPSEVKQGLIHVNSFVDGSQHSLSLNEELGFSWIQSNDGKLKSKGEIQLSHSLTLFTEIVVISNTGASNGELGLRDNFDNIGPITVQPSLNRVGFQEFIDPEYCAGNMVFRRNKITASVYVYVDSIPKLFTDQVLRFALYANEVLIPQAALEAWVNHPYNKDSTRVFPSVIVYIEGMAEPIRIEPDMYIDKGLVRIGKSNTENLWIIPAALLKGYQMEFTKKNVGLCKYMQPDLVPTKWYHNLFSSKSQSPKT